MLRRNTPELQQASSSSSPTSPLPCSPLWTTGCRGSTSPSPTVPKTSSPVQATTATPCLYVGSSTGQQTATLQKGERESLCKHYYVGNDSVRANQTSSLPPPPGDWLRRWARPERSSRRRRASSWSTTSIFPTSPARCWSACPRTCPGPSRQRK